MRISGWSSDVCSSDLGGTCGIVFNRLHHGRNAELIPLDINLAKFLLMPTTDVTHGEPSIAISSAALLNQIGRASCRERVTTSVSISVVDVHLKKKRKNYVDGNMYAIQLDSDD